jgi:hypothetical protein
VYKKISYDFIFKVIYFRYFKTLVFIFLIKEKKPEAFDDLGIIFAITATGLIIITGIIKQFYQRKNELLLIGGTAIIIGETLLHSRIKI